MKYPNSHHIDQAKFHIVKGFDWYYAAGGNEFWGLVIDRLDDLKKQAMALENPPAKIPEHWVMSKEELASFDELFAKSYREIYPSRRVETRHVESQPPVISIRQPWWRRLWTFLFG